MDPEALLALVRRTYRADVRIVLALLRVLGRPIFDFFVAEADGHLAATTLVTYGRSSGYLSTVSVDPRYRRRGFARALLARAHARILRSGRRFAVLDVLEQNAPARALYASAGYGPLRGQVVLAHEPAETELARPPPAPAGLREFHRSDGTELASIANALAPPAVREALPVVPESFRIPPLLGESVEGRTLAWTVDGATGPVAHVRAAVGGITRSAHLSRPVAAPGTDPAVLAGLLRVALGWIAMQGPYRTICEVSVDDGPVLAALGAVGFAPAYRLSTLVRPLAR